MAYGGKPATDTTDAVRLAIGDTSSSPVLTDDEIDYYYSTYGNVLLAASHAAGDLAGRYANRVSKKVGSRSIENVAWVIRGEVAIDFLERYGIRFIRDRGSREAMTTAEVAAGHRQQALRIECH